MSREIKFRAWDGECMMTNLDSVNLEELRVGVVQQGDEVEDQINVTFLQYTELHDCHGKEIWEGDVISLGMERYKVNRRSGCFMADNVRNGHSLTHAKEDVRVWHTLMESSMLIEVLGNIHENPELIRK